MDPHQNHSITLADASVMTAAFRTNNPGMNTGFAFGKEAILAILNQPGCTGLRVYNAEDSNGNAQIVLAGIGNNYDDMYNELLAERAIPIPPGNSSTNNPLNS